MRMTQFANLCLTGRVPAVIQPVFCGASLCALNKKDLETVKHVGLTIGLELNEDKCEIVTDDDSVAANVRVILPNIRHIPCGEVLLLGPSSQ
jgi:hypothetical protein